MAATTGINGAVVHYEVAAGTATHADVLAFWIVMGAAFCSSTVVSYVLERGSRDAFERDRLIETQQREIALQKGRADSLLEAILPASIAEMLKQGPRHIAEHFDEATIVFSDLVGFTPLSETMSPGELVDLLNDIVGRFDERALECGVEKIKTIGDAYMAAAGLPEPCEDHAERAADFALGSPRRARPRQ